ncbi:MAG: adenosyl-hopene transferase HpnH [Minwuia sp.]|uniref:adenosyl-hopene transferase HpnH n=1 Tax=Minwuia sp. TaxID=2493630 RepID=UPI003A87C8B9
MGVPLRQQIRVGAYIVKQRLRRNERYPLVLMLEPLFRCNLACPGCGKIDYPDHILNRRLSVDEAVGAAEECGAPMVSIAGGEPLIHKEMGEIVAELVKRKKFVYLCTNALLLEKKIDLFEPSPYLTFSIHLDGLGEHHDRAVDQKGVFDKTVQAIKLVKSKGFRVNINSTLFDNASADDAIALFDFATELGVEGITVSPGYAYERAPDQQHFFTRQKTKNFFREIFAKQKAKGAKYAFSQSPLFLDFLAGNQEYRCTPWGNPTRNVFGWQRPCYLLNEGYVSTFRELMEETEWEAYGTGNYEKCADCMVHCGYEATAVQDMVKNPLKGLKVALKGIRTEGPMAPEINLENQRPAEYVFDRLVSQADKPGSKAEAGASDAA